MQSLQRDPEEAKDLLAHIRSQKQTPEGDQAPEEAEKVTFDEFIQLMQQVENKLARDEPPGENQLQMGNAQQGIISI